MLHLQWHWRQQFIKNSIQQSHQLGLELLTVFSRKSTCAQSSVFFVLINMSPCLNSMLSCIEKFDVTINAGQASLKCNCEVESSLIAVAKAQVKSACTRVGFACTWVNVACLRLEIAFLRVDFACLQVDFALFGHLGRAQKLVSFTNSAGELPLTRLVRQAKVMWHSLRAIMTKALYSRFAIRARAVSPFMLSLYLCWKYPTVFHGNESFGCLSCVYLPIREVIFRQKYTYSHAHGARIARYAWFCRKAVHFVEGQSIDRPLTEQPWTGVLSTSTGNMGQSAVNKSNMNETRCAVIDTKKQINGGGNSWKKSELVV